MLAIIIILAFLAQSVAFCVMHTRDTSSRSNGTISFFAIWGVLIVAWLLFIFSESDGARVEISRYQIRYIIAAHPTVALTFVLTALAGCIELYKRKTKEAWISLGFGIILALTVVLSAMQQTTAK